MLIVVKQKRALSYQSKLASTKLDEVKLFFPSFPSGLLKSFHALIRQRARQGSERWATLRTDLPIHPTLEEHPHNTLEMLRSLRARPGGEFLPLVLTQALDVFTVQNRVLIVLSLALIVRFQSQRAAFGFVHAKAIQEY